MEWVTTTIMLDRLRDFEDVAWKQFIDRFRGPMIDFARRYGVGEEAAQDIAQDTLMAFAGAYRDGRYDRSRGRLRSWLFGMAYKEVLRHRRDHAEREQQAPSSTGRTEFFAAIPDENEARQAFDVAWARHVMRQCLDRVEREVEPHTFRAFEMCAIHRVPPADVAETLGLSRNAVFIAKHRVLKRLAEMQREIEGEE